MLTFKGPDKFINVPNLTLILRKVEGLVPEDKSVEIRVNNVSKVKASLGRVTEQGKASVYASAINDMWEETYKDVSAVHDLTDAILLTSMYIAMYAGMDEQVSIVPEKIDRIIQSDGFDSIVEILPEVRAAFNTLPVPQKRNRRKRGIENGAVPKTPAPKLGFTAQAIMDTPLFDEEDIAAIPDAPVHATQETDDVSVEDQEIMELSEDTAKSEDEVLALARKSLQYAPTVAVATPVSELKAEPMPYMTAADNEAMVEEASQEIMSLLDDIL